MSMDPADKAKYKNLYLQTGREYVVQMQTNISVLLKNGQKDAPMEAMLLASHSLKSQSLIMGYMTMGLFCATIEAVFKSEKAKKHALENDVLTLIANGLVKLKESMDCIQQNGNELDLTETIHTVQKESGISVSLT